MESQEPKSSTAEVSPQTEAPAQHEVAPGVYELTVTEAVGSVEKQAKKDVTAVEGMQLEGVPAEVSEEARTKLEAEARQSIAEIVGIQEEDVDAAFAEVAPAQTDEAPVSEEVPKSYSPEAFADTIRPAAEAPSLKVEQQEEYPDLPSSILTEKILAKDMDAKTVEQIDQMLREEMGDRYNDDMTAHEAAVFASAFDKIQRELSKGVDINIVTSHLLPELQEKLPRHQTIVHESGSGSEAIAQVNAALPDAWQTKEIRDSLAQGEQLPALAEIRANIGTENLKTFLEDMPKSIAADKRLMQTLFSQENAPRLSAALAENPQETSELLLKTAKIAKDKPHIIPRMLRAESLQTVKMLLDNYSLGMALGRSAELERELGQIIDLNPPKAETAAQELAETGEQASGPAEVRRTLRAGYM
ncbi:hypothetical protein GF391_00005, partial [Candidatus Uhrbacteria bacterium]|nr:hypothetical protein [Candidatus Uhrbacteria bacterium]